jgi:hypothetical protein
MQLRCGKASASEGGGEVFQVLFEAEPKEEDGPYVLIQRAWLEEDEGEFSPYYIETHDEDLIGHFTALDAEITRDHLTVRLPPPTDRIIEIDFTTSDNNFRDIRRVLGIILQRDLGDQSDETT